MVALNLIADYKGWKCIWRLIWVRKNMYALTKSVKGLSMKKET